MANRNIVDDLAALAATPAVDDYVVVIDKSTGEVKSVTTANLVKVSKSAFAMTLLDDANAAALLTTIGLDTDLLTLALPASTTISAFIKTLLDDADAATARTTLGFFPSGTIMLFGQASAPTGWTKKTDWQDNAMFCYASGTPGSGGAVNPQSTHTHTGPSHTHNTPILAHTRPAGTHLGGASFAETNDHPATATSADGTGATGANTAPHYQEVIAATKD